MSADCKLHGWYPVVLKRCPTCYCAEDNETLRGALKGSQEALQAAVDQVNELHAEVAALKEDVASKKNALQFAKDAVDQFVAENAALKESLCKAVEAHTARMIEGQGFADCLRAANAEILDLRGLMGPMSTVALAKKWQEEMLAENAALKLNPMLFMAGMSPKQCVALTFEDFKTMKGKWEADNKELEGALKGSQDALQAAVDQVNTLREALEYIVREGPHGDQAEEIAKKALRRD